MECAGSGWGDPYAWLAVVGMAPGKHGANRTGRPFTGDFAGDLTYATLLKFGLATGTYRADPSDDLQLRGALILNAVKCLPPQNKPEPIEIATCRPYFEAALASLPRVRVLVALGAIAACRRGARAGLKPEPGQVRHGSEVTAPDGRILLGTYHSSRYNQNTRRLTPRCSKRCSSARSRFGMVEAITTERLVLRRARIEDVGPMHLIMRDPVAMRYWSTLPHDSLETTADWVRSMLDPPPEQR